MAGRQKKGTSRSTSRKTTTSAADGAETTKPKKGKKNFEKTDFSVSAANYFGVQVTEAQNKMGSPDVLVGTESEHVSLGIPMKAFALQYVYSSNVYPLGRMEMQIGESDSCKTALLFEKFRWFLRHDGGGSVYFLNEARDPADLRTSIISEELLRRGGFRLEGPCDSMEDWQRRISHPSYGWLRRFERDFKQAGDVAFPVCLGLDSITGTTNEKAIENIDKEGCAKLTFGQDANLLNQYAKYLFQRVYRWPFSFICTNHIKYGQDRYGNKVLRIPGGDELRYVSTYITHLIKLKDIDRLDVAGGRRLLLKTLKSMGDHREIGVEFTWYFDKDTGKQVSVWDWHGATIELLSGFTGERGNEVNDLIDFSTINKTSRTVSCPALGFKKAAPYDEVGQALMHDEKILKSLQDYFGVKRRREFQPNVPYIQQVADAIKAGEVEKHDRSDAKDVESDTEGAESNEPDEVIES